MNEVIDATMSKLKLLHFSVKASTLTRFCAPIMSEQCRMGHMVAAACPDGPYNARIRKTGAILHPIECPVSPDPAQTIRCVWSLYQLLRQEAYDVLYVHQPMGALIGIPAGNLARVPAVFYTTGGFRFHEGMSRPIRMGCMLAETVLMRFVEAVFSPNREDVATAVRSRMLAPERIFYVGTSGGSGIDCDAFRPLAGEERRAARQRIGLLAEDARPIIGIVARAVWEKGYRELLRAFQRLVNERQRSCCLAVVGDGRDFSEMRKWVSVANLQDHVSFLGDRFDVPDLLQGFDIFALPSHREGLPVALSEAMATGLPCVASNVRGCRELITHGETGLLVPPKDEAALFQELERLLCDSALATKLGLQARQHIVDNYSVGQLLPAFMRLNRRLIKQTTGKLL